jgi:membrane protein implicated in regulation of membrane protease activity
MLGRRRRSWQRQMVGSLLISVVAYLFSRIFLGLVSREPKAKKSSASSS